MKQRSRRPSEAAEAREASWDTVELVATPDAQALPRSATPSGRRRCAMPPRCGEGCAEAKNGESDEDSLKTLDLTSKKERQCRNDEAIRMEKKLVVVQEAAEEQSRLSTAGEHLSNRTCALNMGKDKK